MQDKLLVSIVKGENPLDVAIQVLDICKANKISRSWVNGVKYLYFVYFDTVCT